MKKVFDQFSVRSGGRVVVCSNIPTIYRILNIHTTPGSVGRVQLLRPENVIIFFIRFSFLIRAEVSLSGFKIFLLAFFYFRSKQIMVVTFSFYEKIPNYATCNIFYEQKILKQIHLFQM